LKNRSCRSRAVCCCLTMPQLYPAGLAPTNLQQKLNHIACAPLMEESPKGGWSVEIAPQDSIHALIAVHTDEGVTECGSVFADGHLVQAALNVLEPLYLGRMRWNQSASPRSCTRTPLGWSWRDADVHDQRYRHCPLGHIGESHRTAGWSPARWHLSTPHSTILWKNRRE
jgi:hypothetical protein